MRSVPVSCFIYRCEEAKACDKWSTFVKIELNESFVHLWKRFAIEDYGGFKTRAAEKGIAKLDFLLGVKHKKPDPPEFPNGRLYTATTEDEWIIYKEFLLNMEGKEYELVGRSIFDLWIYYFIYQWYLIFNVVIAACCDKHARFFLSVSYHILSSAINYILTANARDVVWIFSCYNTSLLMSGLSHCFKKIFWSLLACYALIISHYFSWSLRFLCWFVDSCSWCRDTKLLYFNCFIFGKLDKWCQLVT